MSCIKDVDFYSPSFLSLNRFKDRDCDNCESKEYCELKTLYSGFDNVFLVLKNESYE